MSLSSPILTSDTDGVKFAKLQRLIRLALDNAGISYAMSGLLSPILTSDTQGVKYAKLGRWLQELATNITGGGGGVTQIVAGAGIGVAPAGGTGVVTISAAAGAGTNSFASAANNAGNTTVTPDAPNYALALTIGGAARTSVIILDVTGRGAGDKIQLVLTLPATPAIVLEVRNATAGGTLLLPAAIFASQQYDTDGVDLSATWEFVFNGAAWEYVLSNIPA